ncbi:hypothetical protein EHP00_88 [Ecytonucleospora hepatopenaei]|uniref:Uncharacterized protein n=1 Tax=Ecytonucleospora hepatopenaei TaxID=646526 RepID=A0A1W0E5Q4_9MICR|nr:hypothetical protein EHP00_88 [Ecytonucleospora hepatopenaei]
MTNKKEKNLEENYLPTQYLNNENPYSFRHNYDQNIANMAYNKEKLNLLHRVQPQKLNVIFDQKSLNDERNYMILEAITVRRKNLLNKAFKILKREVILDKSAEEILEEYIENPEILDILLELKKMNLINQQMKLRAKVSHVVSLKISDVAKIDSRNGEKVNIDNLREALIFSSLYKFYSGVNEK